MALELGPEDALYRIIISPPDIGGTHVPVKDRGTEIMGSGSVMR